MNFKKSLVLTVLVIGILLFAGCPNPNKTKDPVEPVDIWDGSIGVLEPTEPEGSIFEINSAAEFAALTDSFSFYNDQIFELKVNIDLGDRKSVV